MKITQDDGTVRYVHGRLRYPGPPEPGTILGPNTLGEYLVVVGQDGADTLVAYATVPDLDAARARAQAGAVSSAWSVAETRLR